MGNEQRRHARITGPFNGSRVGLIDSPVMIYDLSEGGCFVNSVAAAPDAGRNLVLKIEVPDEGWVCLKSQVIYAKPEFGFAVSFVDVPRDASERLRRGVLRRQGLLPDAEKDPAIGLPACPRCHKTAVRPLGMAGSSVPWFACQSCDCVWAARDITIAPEPSSDDDATAAQPSGVQQILVADDDGGVLGLVRKALSNYRVHTARDVAEAFALGRSAPVDLLITDYLMPDGTGAELINRLRESQPSLKVLIMTGHEAMLDEQGYHWWTKERHLGKPFTVDALRHAVAELIGVP